MDVNPKQKEFFDEHADVWDVISVHDTAIVEYIASLLALKGNEDVLDVGTGTGVMIPYYERYLKNGTVTGLDYSEKMIEVAKRKYPERRGPTVRYRVGDLYDLDESDCYDTIVCYSCFPHFPDKKGAMKLLSAALRKGGMLMISHGCSRDKINQVHREGGEAICHDYLPDEKGMRELFTDAGLDVTFVRDDNDMYIVVGKKL